MERPTVWRMLARVLTLSCPRCGRGRLFASYFIRAKRCTECAWTYERGAGYWVGGSEVHMFLTYGLSAFLCAPLVIWLGSSATVMVALIFGHVALSLVLFRFSRSAFLGLDYLLDPSEPERGDEDDRGDPEPPPRPRTPPGLARRRPPRIAKSAPRPRTPAPAFSDE